MLRFRFVVCVFVFLSCATLPAQAHRLEPISTEFARPFAPKNGSLQITYEFERDRNAGVRTQAIPDAEFELGITRRMQISVAMPLLRVEPDGLPAVTTAGHLEFAARYLLAGGDRRTFAVSINPFVEAPTGNHSVTGGATEAGVSLHVDKEFGNRVYFRGNYGWSLGIGGSEPREHTFRYHSAFVFPISYRWNPVLELLGATDTATGRTSFAVQPEIICYINSHWELKAGVPFGTTQNTAGIGVRAQVAWIFGRGGSD